MTTSITAAHDSIFPIILRFTVCSSAVVSNMEEGERKAMKADSEEAQSTTCSSTRSVPEHQPGTGSVAADSDADKTDVCSDNFDPLFALYSPSVSLPFPNVKCFNNVSEYESFLKGGRGRAKPENVEKKRLKAKKGVADPERIERLKKLMVNNPVAESESSSTPRSRRQKPQKNVLTRMPCRFYSMTTCFSHRCFYCFKVHVTSNLMDIDSRVCSVSSRRSALSVWTVGR